MDVLLHLAQATSEANSSIRVSVTSMSRGARGVICRACGVFWCSNADATLQARHAINFFASDKKRGWQGAARTQVRLRKVPMLRNLEEGFVPDAKMPCFQGEAYGILMHIGICPYSHRQIGTCIFILSLDWSNPCDATQSHLCFWGSYFAPKTLPFFAMFISKHAGKPGRKATFSSYVPALVFDNTC